MALTIGPATAQTASGFTVAVSQGAQPSAWLNDTVYVVQANEGSSMAEPGSTVGPGLGQYLLKSTITSFGTTSVTFTGLPEQGKQYHVIAYRHFSDATPTEKATYTHSNAYEQGCTLEHQWRHVHRTTLTEDWSKGHGNFTTDQWTMPQTQYYEASTDATVGTKWTNTVGGTPIKSRFVWRHDAAWTIACKIRQRTAQPWASLTVMTSEAEYVQIYTSGGVVAVTEYGGSAGLWQAFSLGTHSLNTWKNFEIRYDGSSVLTYYYDGALVATHAFGTFSGPLTCWIGEVTGTSGVTDYGPITVTGDFDIWGFTCAGANRGFRDPANYGIYAGAEGTIGFYYDAGGITLRSGTGNMGSQQWNASPSTFTSGAGVAKSPDLYPAPGYKFGSLKLAGRTNSNGSLLARVYDTTGTLIPDSQITGNSAGFSPTGTSTTSVDLTGVTAPSIYVQLNVTCTATTTRPPVWQKCAVEFTAGRLRRPSVSAGPRRVGCR